MKIIKSILAFGLLLQIISCKSVVNNSSRLEVVFKKHSLMYGQQEYKIRIHKYDIAALITHPEDLNGVSELLKELELEWNSTAYSQDVSNPNFSKSLGTYVFIKRKDNKPIPKKYSPELEKLREFFPEIYFGLGLFYQGGVINGVLTNRITVIFEQNVSENRINELLTATQAINFSRSLGNLYDVEFPRSWTYEIIDASKQISKLQEVQSVSHDIASATALD